MSRRILEFDCNGAQLVGILDPGSPEATRAVVVVVGGPQYRIGSHRQFLLLARALSAEGYPVLRFDQRGAGDSEGTTTFESLDDDLRAAIDALQAVLPKVREVVIWGLCDAASAALMYCRKDDRVAGLVLLNPWVRSESTLARSYFQHYYGRQLISREFWKRLAGGQLNIRNAVSSLIGNLRAVTVRKTSATAGSGRGSTLQPFQERMLEGFQHFHRPVLFILSGEDLTAKEFLALVDSRREWRKAMRRDSVSRSDIADASHTFSSREWRDSVARATRDWLESW